MDRPDQIPNDVRLFRRVHPEMITYDSNLNRWRPTSANFANTKDANEMSVFAENLAQAANEEPQGFVRGRWAEWYLAAVLAGHMRAQRQTVYPDFAGQEANDRFASHSEVAGDKPEKVRKKLGAGFEWVIPPIKSKPAC